MDFYDPTKIFGNIIAKAQAGPQGNDRLNELYNNLVKPTLKAIPRVVTHTAASLQQMPISGISALARLIATGGNLEVANKILEENQKVLDDYYLTNPEEKKAAENIGLATKPFQMAGEGLKNIVEQTSLKDTIAEPIAATIGEAAAMFGFGGIRGAVKGRVDKAFKSLEDTIPGANGEPYSFGEFVKDTEPIVKKAEELNNVQKAVDNIPDEALKAAYEKILDVEKTQLELEAKAVQDKIDHKKVAEEDLKAKGEEVQKIKEGKEEVDTELPSFDSDKEMLKSLGYEEAEIAKMTAEEKVKIIEGDEIVESLNELKEPQPVKSGIDLLNQAIDELPVETKVKGKKVKKEKKAKDVEEPLTIYHRTFDEGIKEVDFDAFYGTKEFSDAYKADFGPIEHKLIVPSEVASKIVDLTKDSPLATRLKIDILKEWAGDIPEIDKFIKEIKEGKDKNKDSEVWGGNFYEAWVDKNIVLAALRKNNLSGAFYSNEYILTKEAIKASRDIEAKRPITDLDLQTGTPLPEKLRPTTHPFRDKDPKHTETMHKLLQEKVNNVYASPEVFTRYLINEVNRYLNGEEVNIDKVRNGLSELATRADNLKNQFDITADFNQWKGTVREAARWAREADRLIDKRSGETKFMVGIDPTEVVKVIEGLKKLMKERYAKDNRLSTSGYIFDDGETVNLTTKTKTGYDSIPHEAALLKGLSDLDREIVYRVISANNTDYSILTPYLEKSGTVRYVREEGNTISVQVGQKLTEQQLRVINKSIGGQGTVHLEMPGKNITIKMNQLGGVVDRYFDSKAGLKLYSGIDPTEATKKIVAGAKALASYTAKARGMKEIKPIEAAQRIREELTRSFIDRSGNIRKELLDNLGQEGYEIIQKMYLSKGASSLAAQNLKQMRKEVYDGLTKDDKRILDNLILADRMLDIGKYKTTSQFKFPEGLSPVESAAYNELFQFVEKITPEKADLLKQRAQAYFDWMKKPLKDMLDAELIDQAEYDALASHNYRRLKLVDVFDKRYTAKTGKTKRTVYDSGVEALSHGRQTDVFEPSSEVMALEVFNRAYGRILNNAANKTLLDLARNQKDNPFVAVKETPSDHVPSGWDRVFVYDKGERKAIYLSPLMAKEWITNNPEMSYKLSQTIRYASGSPVLRTFATGIDWDFALRNLPRDVMHIWYAARVFENGKWKPLYNTASPVYAAQIGLDIGGVFSDALLRKGRYQEYIKEGGGMEFLVHQGRLMQRGRHIEGGLDKVQDFLGYFGETSEIMTRLAVRDRVIKRRASEQGLTYEEASKNKKITQEATFAARDYMDFGQGGGITKALDNGIPYLNASIQGSRGLYRAFKDNFKESVLKLTQFATVVSGLYIASNIFSPLTMQALQGDIVTQSNVCLPLGDMSFIDEKGQTRYIYLKVLPLDPGQKFFKKFFEASTDKWLGNSIDVDGTVNTLSQLSPVGTSSLPPIVAGSLGYTYNKNFWSGEDIWNKTDKPLGWPNSKEEYIPGKTPQVFQDIGSLTGLSPERTKYAVSQLFTSGTMWGQLVGAGYDKLFGGLSKDKKEMHIAEILSKMPITKNFIGITNPYTQFAGPINEAKEQGMLKRWIENRGLDQRVESYLFEGGKRSDVIDYIHTTAKDQNTLERLKDRFVFQEKIKALPNRSFWLSLKGIPDTEARAKMFVQRFDSAPVDKQEQMNREIGIVTNAGGVISDHFKQEVMKIRDANARAKSSQ
jgi:hypothetical protein